MRRRNESGGFVTARVSNWVPARNRNERCSLEVRKTTGDQSRLDFAPVTGVACSPPALAVVEICKESIPSPDRAFPSSDVDRLREDADRLGREILLSSNREYICRIERSVTASIIDNITPHFEDPETANQGFVDWSNRHLSEVIEVATECCATVASEFLRARLGFGNDR